jgi:phosphocarrier protein
VSKGDTVTIASDDEAALDELEQLLATDHDA